jgi:hypothetical protein
LKTKNKKQEKAHIKSQEQKNLKLTKSKMKKQNKTKNILQTSHSQRRNLKAVSGLDHLMARESLEFSQGVL